MGEPEPSTPSQGETANNGGSPGRLVETESSQLRSSTNTMCEYSGAIATVELLSGGPLGAGCKKTLKKILHPSLCLITFALRFAIERDATEFCPTDNHVAPGDWKRGLDTRGRGS